MNKNFLGLLLPALTALSFASVLCRGDMGGFYHRNEDSLQLNARVYVFRGAEVAHAVAVSGGGTQDLADDGHWVVLTAPVTLDLGGEELSIEGSKFSWQPPAAGASKFSLISSPAAALAPNAPATVVIGEKTQYMERQSDGSYRLRELPAGAPGSAHCDLNLTVRPAESPAGPLLVTCVPDIAAIQGREALPGVDLDVGKPILASFKDTLTFAARPGEWTCLYNRSPGGGDYGLLVLISIGDGTTAPSLAMPPPAPSVAVDTVVDVATKTAVPQPSAGHPIYYWPVVRGYTDLGSLKPGDVTPPSAAIEHVLAESLYAHGYRLATKQSPPSEILVIWWGYVAPTIPPEPKTLLAHLTAPAESDFDRQLMLVLVEGYRYNAHLADRRLNAGDPELPLLKAAEAAPRYYLMVSAYNSQELIKHHNGRLWDERVSTGAAGISLPDALATLIAAAGPQLARATNEPLIAEQPVVRGELLGQAQVSIDQLSADSTDFNHGPARNPGSSGGSLSEQESYESGFHSTGDQWAAAHDANAH